MGLDSYIPMQNFQIRPTLTSSLLHQSPLPGTFFRQNNVFHAFITPYMGLNNFGILSYPHSLGAWP